MEKELDGMKPPGRDIKTVKAQLDDLGRFYKKLERLEDLVADSEKAAETLADNGHGDSDKARDQVCIRYNFKDTFANRILFPTVKF